MKSPFKFLDAYTSEDNDVFFGRDQEVETLYQLIYKSRLLLVYGQSGTGKTSLLQCGLGGRFDLTDWYPFQIRRNDDLNQSLKEALARPAGGKLRKDSLPETIAYIYKNYLRPVYLIFDQFEELFILGSQEEQEIFINSIKEILAAELPCKIVLVMREEYIAQLYAFEQTIPSLFDRRLRVEPMNYANVAKVISGSCEKFNISLNEKDKNITQIIDNISGGKSGIQLPYLQVYLDRLWQEDYHRTYPNGLSEASAEAYPALEFTAEEIVELGNIEDVLEKFLREQRKQIQEQLHSHYADLPENTTQQVIDLFVTEEGTKRPILYTREEGEIQLEPRLQRQLAAFPSAAVQEILLALEQARILRFTDTQVELAHDSLAELIDRERSTEQRQLNQIKRRVAAAYVENRESSIFLTARQLASIEEYIPRLNLEPHLAQFIKDCYTDAEAKEKAEAERIQRELQLAQEKLAAEQKSAKRQRIFSGMIGIALVIAMITGGWALNQQKVAKEALKKAQDAETEKIIPQVDDILQRADTLRQRGYETPYRKMLEDAQSLLEDFGDNPSLQAKKREVDSLLNK